MCKEIMKIRTYIYENKNDQEVVCIYLKALAINHQTFKNEKTTEP